MEDEFNPLDKGNLGESVVSALLQSEKVSLADFDSFNGAGIYAIYYCGDFGLYEFISESELPIYVGKAIPKGGRKGVASPIGKPSRALFQRLKQHAKTIDAVDSLDLSDFYFQSLAVDDIWISLGENLALKRFVPLWNTVVEGFGNHDPGSGRYKGKRPIWDELHPGRSWAERCQPAKLSLEEIEKKIKSYAKEH